MELVTFATRVCKLLDVKTMVGGFVIFPRQRGHNVDHDIVTNAAGGLNPNYDVGDIVVLNDVHRSILDLRRPYANKW